MSQYFFYRGKVISYQIGKWIIKIMRQKSETTSVEAVSQNCKCEQLHDSSCACPHERHIEHSREPNSMGEERTSALASSEGCTHPITQCRDPPLETPKPSVFAIDSTPRFFILDLWDAPFTALPPSLSLSPNVITVSVVETTRWNC